MVTSSEDEDSKFNARLKTTHLNLSSYFFHGLGTLKLVLVSKSFFYSFLGFKISLGSICLQFRLRLRVFTNFISLLHHVCYKTFPLNVS